MDFLAKWLQGNPTAVVLMFFFTVFGGLATLIGFFVGFKKLYRIYLSRQVSLPRWVLILAGIGFCVLMLIRLSPEGETQVDLTPVHDKTFGVQRVILDGKLFAHCTFNRTEMIFRGKEPYSMVSCAFNDCKWTLTDNAALTLSNFTAMYASDATRPVVEATIQNIRMGVHPKPTIPIEIK